jgi:hypothetical protein
METRGIESSPFLGWLRLPVRWAPMEQESAGRGSCDHPYGSRGAQGKSVAGDTGEQGAGNREQG